MRKLLGYMSKQIGWVEQSKVEKSLGAVDDRKVAAMVALGLLQRDGANLKLAPRGAVFASGDEAAALKEALHETELYRHTLEWVHYQGKSEVTATEIGQYWEASHKDSVGSLSGGTLNAGAVCFARVAEGAGFGIFKVGRAGKETRLTPNQEAIAKFVDGGGDPTPGGDGVDETPAPSGPTDAGASATATPAPAVQAAPAPSAPSRTVAVTTSPSVHVNVEIHIAADATANTVKEIFRNMALYVLDKQVNDADE